ncbi:SPOR domain-containing protein [Sphingomonas flavalba]|uniref:SPOR domain-containing protein n=1 Tax=Sphingomonas flavalba TaxID=2559804 RepID=UPI001EF15ED8|nr:SPOR domain-containing protein [Sphingomonas flavalba]
MNSRFSFGRSAGTFAVGLLITAISPLAAQIVTPGGVLPAGAPPPSSADRLTAHLRELARDPENLVALKGAGDAALDIGDANAALAFYARAERLAPRDGAIKAGLARAMLKAENPRDALRLFDDATDLGVPAAAIAGDRGLAHDLRGEPRKAQKDYALALTRGPDDEVTRRYALSLAISGDREQALALLDPLLHKRDQAAWRARAFVLALTGDPAGAGKIVEAMMPAPMAGAMQPFLVRLGGLKPTQKALAVHLGQFPADKPTRLAAADRAESTPPRTRRAGRNQPATGGAQPAVAAPAPKPAPTQEAPVRMTAEARRGALAEIISGLRIPENEVIASAAKASGPAPARPAPARAEAPPPKAPAKPKPTKAELAKQAAAKKAAAQKAAAKKAPSRVWVQVASGANRSDLPKAWNAVKGKAAELKNRSAHTAKAGATNRLLVGPFKTSAEAQAFVNKLNRQGVKTFVFTSSAGQEVEKIGAK